jgi:hypothetical protein
MIDQTTINITPLPSKIIKIQEMNDKLRITNNLLTSVVCITVFVAIYALTEKTIQEANRKRNLTLEKSNALQ